MTREDIPVLTSGTCNAYTHNTYTLTHTHRHIHAYTHMCAHTDTDTGTQTYKHTLDDDFILKNECLSHENEF